MQRSLYVTMSAMIFALVAVVHAYRAAMAIPVQLGDTAVAVWPSWVVAVGAGVLAVWGFRSRG
jgi:hypothetical protein